MTRRKTTDSSTAVRAPLILVAAAVNCGVLKVLRASRAWPPVGRPKPDPAVW
jgi:hypothetical protein